MQGLKKRIKKPHGKCGELKNNGGRGWIRTIEARSNRFTVCPLWPLGNSPILLFSKKFLSYSEIEWSWWTDSNPRPADYKSAALPTELHQHFQRSNIIAYKTDFVKQKFCFFRTFSKVFYEYLRLWAAQRYDRSLRIKYNMGVGRALRARP